jgi:hypothetical protein
MQFIALSLLPVSRDPDFWFGYAQARFATAAGGPARLQWSDARQPLPFFIFATGHFNHESAG